MMESKTQFQMVGCIPLSMSPMPPEDQPGCLSAICPSCENKMWVSSKKRAIIASDPRYIALCLICCVRIHKMNGAKSTSEINLININDLGNSNGEGSGH